MPRKKQPDYSWMNDDPPEEEISRLSNGAEFLDIGIIETLLYKLDTHWGTEHFHFKMFVGNTGAALADGSLELVVTYAGRTRRLVGAATLVVPEDVDVRDPETNANYGATLKSECTKNAVKPLGRRFGQGLNDRLTVYRAEVVAPKRTMFSKPAPVEMIPDAAMQKSYNKAVEDGNEYMTEAIKATYPSIQYTGEVILSKTITNAESIFNITDQSK